MNVWQTLTRFHILIIRKQRTQLYYNKINANINRFELIFKSNDINVSFFNTKLISLLFYNQINDENNLCGYGSDFFDYIIFSDSVYYLLFFKLKLKFLLTFNNIWTHISVDLMVKHFWYALAFDSDLDNLWSSLKPLIFETYWSQLKT